MTEEDKLITAQFPENEQGIVTEMISAIEELFARVPVVGFHHSFYVPGWVGSIQLHFVEKEMEKEAEKPFYDGMGYFDCANWIIEKTDQFASLHATAKPEVDGEEMARWTEQSGQIVFLVHKLIEAWAHCYPEIATIVNRKIDDMVISAVGLLQLSTNSALAKITEMKEDEGPAQPGCLQSMKDAGYNILGMLCNLIVLSIIWGIVGSIISIFS